VATSIAGSSNAAKLITLDEIAAGASLAMLTRDEIVAVLSRLSAAQTRVFAWFAESAPRAPQGEDRLIDADEAAQRLSVKVPWLYRRTKSLPFVVRLDGKVLFSSHGIDAFIAAKRKSAR
jgi:predicted DNA-binding transcriptional regulator AlpA